MIRTYDARIIWIGRREIDAEIQHKIDKLAYLGTAPHYIAADATNRQALQNAYEEIKRHYAQIHGVIHAAIVLLDKSLGSMDEERFQTGLSAKVNVSVYMAQVFGQEPLDFVLFFSSIQSFIKSAGQSNYAAGCTFKDAYAQRLRQEWPCAVKVMNWGYWGSVGIVASQEYRDRMAQIGVGSIESEEGMDALEILLNGSMHQVALMKTTKQQAKDWMNLTEAVHVYAPIFLSMTSGIHQALLRSKKLPSTLGEKMWTGEQELLHKVQEAFLRTTASVLNVPVEDIEVEKKLNENGFDPILLRQVVSQLNQEYALDMTLGAAIK